MPITQPSTSPMATRFFYKTLSTVALIEKWCGSNMMVLNSQNFPFLFLVKNAALQKHPTTKLLGFVVNNALTWSDHICRCNLQKSLCKRSPVLKKNIGHLIDLSTSKLFYYNCIHSQLIYGIHLYLLMSLKLT